MMRPPGSRSRQVLWAFALVGVLVASAAAQPFVSGTQPKEGFGTGLASLGDINRDGTDDFAVGSPRATVGTQVEAGFVQIFSGASAQVLGRLEGQKTDDHFGTSVAGLGDVNSDGIPDIAVGIPGSDAPPSDPFSSRRPIPRAGRVSVYSGANLALLWSFDGETRNAWVGSAMASGGDLDGDGRQDLVVSGPYAAGPRGGEDPGPGEVYALSGATGAEIFRFTGDKDRDEFGHSVAGGLDLDGDGRPEIVVGAWEADPNGRAAAGSVYVYKGGNGTLLKRLDGHAPDDHFGGDASLVPDMTGDGVPDLLVGATDVVTGLADGGGEVLLYSGADWSEVYSRADPWVRQNYHLGVTILGAQDLDGDSVPDFLAAAPRADTGAGSLFLFSGKTGTVFGRMNGSAAHHNLGRRMAPIRYAGGTRGFLIGAPGPDTREHQIGRVYLCTATDSDGDGAWDCLDNCPRQANSSQADTDHDGIGDECDTCTDRDGDGFGEHLTAADACPLDLCPIVFNLDQTDTDGDGVGDVCDNCTILRNPQQGGDQACRPLGGRIRIGHNRRSEVNRFAIKLGGGGFDPTMMDATVSAPLKLIIEDASGTSLFLRDMPGGMVRRVGARKARYRVPKRLSTGIDSLTVTLSKRGVLAVRIRGHGVASPTGPPAARFNIGDNHFAALGTTPKRRKRRK